MSCIQGFFLSSLWCSLGSYWYKHAVATQLPLKHALQLKGTVSSEVLLAHWEMLVNCDTNNVPPFFLINHFADYIHAPDNSEFSIRDRDHTLMWGQTYIDSITPNPQLVTHIQTCIHTLLAERSLINSLWPSDAMWQQRSGSTLAQVMACCLTASSHYLNQYWCNVSKVQLHSYNGNFTKDTSAIDHWN